MSTEKMSIFFVVGFTPHTGYFLTKDMHIAYPLPLSFASVLMKDAQCAESNEKINFPFFIFRFIVKFHRNLDCFEYKNDRNSKNKSRQIDYSFISLHSASFM